VTAKVDAALNAADPTGTLPVGLSVQFGDAEPVRIISREPPIAVVSSAEIGRQGGVLDARYWVEREDRETPAAYRRRLQALDAIRRAEGHERTAARLREEAAELLAGGDQQ
jgi:hypothetical protein